MLLMLFQHHLKSSDLSFFLKISTQSKVMNFFLSGPIYFWCSKILNFSRTPWSSAYAYTQVRMHGCAPTRTLHALHTYAYANVLLHARNTHIHTCAGVCAGWAHTRTPHAYTHTQAHVHGWVPTRMPHAYTHTYTRAHARMYPYTHGTRIVSHM